MGIPSDGSYGIPEGVIYGYPVTCKGGQYEIVKGIEISRVQPQAHGRDAEGAARGARRRQASLGEIDVQCGRAFSRSAEAGEAAAGHRHDLRLPRAAWPSASGYQAIYLSGGGVAAGSLGLPDLGISNLDDVLTDVRRITDVCDLPLLVDVDTGFGASAFNVARTTRSLIKFGAAAMHIEDQVGAKRCGHRPGKELVSEGGDGATASRPRWTRAPIRRFVVMARTDALANEGFDSALSSVQ